MSWGASSYTVSDVIVPTPRPGHLYFVLTACPSSGRYDNFPRLSLLQPTLPRHRSGRRPGPRRAPVLAIDAQGVGPLAASRFPFSCQQDCRMLATTASLHTTGLSGKTRQRTGTPTQARNASAHRRVAAPVPSSPENALP